MLFDTKEWLVEWWYDALDWLSEAGEIVGFLVGWWLRFLLKLPFYVLLLAALLVQLVWRASRRQNVYAQIGIGIMTAGIVAMLACAIAAGHSNNPVYLTPLGVIVLGGLIMAFTLPDADQPDKTA